MMNFAFKHVVGEKEDLFCETLNEARGIGKYEELIIEKQENSDIMPSSKNEKPKIDLSHDNKSDQNTSSEKVSEHQKLIENKIDWKKQAKEKKQQKKDKRKNKVNCKDKILSCEYLEEKNEVKEAKIQTDGGIIVSEESKNSIDIVEDGESIDKISIKDESTTIIGNDQEISNDKNSNSNIIEDEELKALRLKEAKLRFEQAKKDKRTRKEKELSDLKQVSETNLIVTPKQESQDKLQENILQLSNNVSDVAIQSKPEKLEKVNKNQVKLTEKELQQSNNGSAVVIQSKPENLEKVKKNQVKLTEKELQQSNNGSAVVIQSKPENLEKVKKNQVKLQNSEKHKSVSFSDIVSESKPDNLEKVKKNQDRLQNSEKHKSVSFSDIVSESKPDNLKKGKKNLDELIMDEPVKIETLLLSHIPKLINFDESNFTAKIRVQMFEIEKLLFNWLEKIFLKFFSDNSLNGNSSLESLIHDEDFKKEVIIYYEEKRILKIKHKEMLFESDHQSSSNLIDKYKKYLEFFNNELCKNHTACSIPKLSILKHQEPFLDSSRKNVSKSNSCLLSINKTQENIKKKHEEYEFYDLSKYLNYLIRHVHLRCDQEESSNSSKYIWFDYMENILILNNYLELREITIRRKLLDLEQINETELSDLNNKFSSNVNSLKYKEEYNKIELKYENNEQKIKKYRSDEEKRETFYLFIIETILAMKSKTINHEESTDQTNKPIQNYVGTIPKTYGDPSKNSYKYKDKGPHNTPTLNNHREMPNEDRTNNVKGYGNSRYRGQASNVGSLPFQPFTCSSGRINNQQIKPGFVQPQFNQQNPRYQSQSNNVNRLNPGSNSEIRINVNQPNNDHNQNLAVSKISKTDEENRTNNTTINLTVQNSIMKEELDKYFDPIIKSIQDNNKVVLETCKNELIHQNLNLNSNLYPESAQKYLMIHPLYTIPYYIRIESNEIDVDLFLRNLRFSFDCHLAPPYTHVCHVVINPFYYQSYLVPLYFLSSDQLPCQINPEGDKCFIYAVCDENLQPKLNWIRFI